MALETMRPPESVGQHLEGLSGTAGPEIAEKTGPDVVCTTAEGNYFYGLAALANSLVRAGFKGSIVVGYRHGKPTWLETLEKDPQCERLPRNPGGPSPVRRGPGNVALGQLQRPFNASDLSRNRAGCRVGLFL